MVNERKLTAVSSDPRDNTVLTPASLLTFGLDPYTSVGRVHDKDELRRDYRFNLALVDRFWHDWLDFFLPTLQGKNKWRETARNFKIGQLLLVGDKEDLLTKGKHRVGRVAKTFPQTNHGKPIVRRAKIAVTNFDSGKGTMSLTTHLEAF